MCVQTPHGHTWEEGERRYVNGVILIVVKDGGVVEGHLAHTHLCYLWCGEGCGEEHYGDDK